MFELLTFSIHTWKGKGKVREGGRREKVNLFIFLLSCFMCQGVNKYLHIDHKTHNTRIMMFCDEAKLHEIGTRV
jgi:hypothetical protein